MENFVICDLLMINDYFSVAQTTVLIGVNSWPLPLIIYDLLLIIVSAFISGYWLILAVNSWFIWKNETKAGRWPEILSTKL